MIKPRYEAFSSCCGAACKVEGIVTMYHVCAACGRACDAVEDDRPFVAGDEVVTEFCKREKEKLRIVESCSKAPFNSQTKWWVKTKCGLYADSAWFKKRDKRLWD